MASARECPRAVAASAHNPPALPADIRLRAVSIPELFPERGPGVSRPFFLCGFLAKWGGLREITPSFSWLEFVGRDLEVEAIRIAKINRVRDLVVFEFEIDSALFQLLLGADEIRAIGPEREMPQPIGAD